MGANEKVDATSTEEVRGTYSHHRSISMTAYRREQFDRWLELVKAEAKAEALNEAATELNRLDTDVEMYDENLRATQVEWWLRKRAEQIRGGS